MRCTCIENIYALRIMNMPLKIIEYFKYFPHNSFFPELNNKFIIL